MIHPRRTPVLILCGTAFCAALTPSSATAQTGDPYGDPVPPEPAKPVPAKPAPAKPAPAKPAPAKPAPAKPTPAKRAAEPAKPAPIAPAGPDQPVGIDGVDDPATPKRLGPPLPSAAELPGGVSPDSLPPIPLAPPPLFPHELADDAKIPLAGIRDGRPFFRTEDDNFRFFIGGRLRSDFLWSPGESMPERLGGGGLNPALVIRRARFELHGEMFRRLAFTLGVELGGGRIGETEYIGPRTPRHSMPNAADGQVRPAEVSLSYRFREWLNFTLGSINTPFSMSNRTREYATPFMERNLAIRGFVVPDNKDLGLTAWGEIGKNRFLSYEIGVFGGDGIDRPFADARIDAMARVYLRPFAQGGESSLARLGQIGFSARHGQRDQSFVNYDYPTLASAQGTVLWQPGYVDSRGRVTKVIPSGAQNAIGAELRLPFEFASGRGLDLRGEVYYLVNNTREAIQGFENTNTERFGRISGAGWYVMASFWPVGDPFASGEPGVHRPVTLVENESSPLRGLEIIALASGVNANYDGATRRDSVADANTPNANIAVYQFGVATQFWYSRNFRTSINYSAYFAPDSNDPTRNQVRVPSNVALPGTTGGDGNFLHELGMRAAVTF